MSKKKLTQAEKDDERDRIAAILKQVLDAAAIADPKSAFVVVRYNYDEGRVNPGANFQPTSAVSTILARAKEIVDTKKPDDEVTLQ